MALPPAVDLEFQGNCPARPAPVDVIHDLEAFVERVELATGRPTVFYIVDDFDDAYGVRLAFDRPQWRRSIGHRPAAGWLLWQADDRGQVEGVRGDVDLDVASATAT